MTVGRVDPSGSSVKPSGAKALDELGHSRTAGVTLAVRVEAPVGPTQRHKFSGQGQPRSRVVRCW